MHGMEKKYSLRRLEYAKKSDTLVQTGFTLDG